MLGGCVRFGVDGDGFDADFFGCSDDSNLKMSLEVARAEWLDGALG